ncbi:MAG: sugar phosphate nucleotidyltransferase [Bacillota bacterium]|nr:sugar phosphate nucleotidyltransferase [Bacillota bacterium]
MKAIIMAGGQGTRLRPLTCNLPKPMLPIMEKPVMQYTIELLKKSGITDIGVTLQYLPDEIIGYFGDGKEFGVNIQYFIEQVPLGTAGSVKNAERFLDDTFIVISGDALTDIDIDKALQYHREKGGIATLILKEVQVPLEYGVVVTEKDGRIKGFLEKPSWSEVFSDKVNTGIYILEPEVFNYYEEGQQFDFSNDLFPIFLKNQKPMYGYVADGYWCDIGNIEQFIKCHHDIMNKIVNVDIRGKIINDVYIGDNTQISKDAKISPPAYIGSNTKIYSSAHIGPYTILGKNNIISSGATIKRSVVFDNCYFGNNSEVRGSVICDKVQLENGVSIFEEAAIGKETLIGRRAVIKPGIKIWPNKVVGTSAIVKSNIIWGGKYSRSLFGKNGISGEVNVDITPEYVSKLGSAYGSMLKADSKVAISCSDDGAAQMFKYSLATGLMSMGVEVYDLKRTTTAMTRQATVFFGLQGSIHVAVDKEDNQRVNIIFIDKDGLNISKAMERKIESSFIREDYRRSKTDAFKIITHFSDCIDYYTRQIINQLNINRIREKKYKVVFSTRNNIIKSVMEKIFHEVGVGYRFYDQPKDLVGLSNEVKENSANFGVYISDEADTAVFVDDKGNIISQQGYEALMAIVSMNHSKFKLLAYPVTESLTMDYVAKTIGAKIIRTKTSQRAILDEYIKNDNGLGRNAIVNIYLSMLDAINVTMLTINMMVSSNVSLSAIMGKLPKYYMKRKEVPCPWDKKGTVMRNIIENCSSSTLELIEGVRINFEDSWVLVLPDADEPICRVYVEAENEEKAEILLNEMVLEIYEIINEDSKKKEEVM